MESSNKYPRALAKIETTSRRQYDLEKIQISPEDVELLNKRGTFSFANAYPYIFDALSTLCTKYATEEYRDEDGKVRNVIERQDNLSETHYRTTITIETFMDMSLNGHNEYMRNFLVQLYKLATQPEKKVLPLTKDKNILTEPIRIDLVTEKGNKLTKAEKIKLSNLKSNRNPEEKSGKITLIIIEFYKPLFECLLRKNKSGKLGHNYIQTPKALHAETKACMERLEATGFFKEDDLEDEKVPLRAREIRAIFLYLTQHDNRHGMYITIDVIDFVKSCFPSCLRNYTDQKVDTKEYISRTDGFLIRNKIKKAIVVFKQMGKNKKMDGGQFIPIELDETKVQYNHEGQTYRIRVLRPKNSLAPIFYQNDIEA